jgi:uncharacterized hydrophobic protein (TIGR00271 family)
MSGKISKEISARSITARPASLADEIAMTPPDTTTRPPSLRSAFAQRFSLLDDKADDADIDRSVRGGVELRGATPWILMLAILIASIGLNINSTAVIIGAMLVSPLMGPIVGVGYGIGIFDFALIRRSLANLGIAAGISLLTSTLYFLVTPLGEAQSELLARTTPTLWDVLIALAGGLAGIIGQTRREKTTVIPGVAIATALMPPLCTAGYGLANANWSVFGGAFYLFSINCVFIAFAAVVVIEFLKLPHRKFVDPRRERRVKRALLAIVLLTGLPSIYLAARLVDNEVFSSRARDFVRSEFRSRQVHVVETRVEGSTHNIEVTLIGPRLSTDAIHAIEQRLTAAGLTKAHLIVHQAEDSKVDVGSLKADILAELVRSNEKAVNERDDTIGNLQKQLATQRAWLGLSDEMAREFAAQYPQCENILVGVAARHDADKLVPAPFLSADCRPMPKAAEVERIDAWLKVRTKDEQAQLVLRAAAAKRRR